MQKEEICIVTYCEKCKLKASPPLLCVICNNDVCKSCSSKFGSYGYKYDDPLRTFYICNNCVIILTNNKVKWQTK